MTRRLFLLLAALAALAPLAASCTPYPPPLTATPALGRGTVMPTFTAGPSPTPIATITLQASPTPALQVPPGEGGAATPFMGE